MPIRATKQYSDRGSIKDIQNGEEILPPTDYELRLKNLYQHGIETRNQALLDSLGFITMDGPANNPVSVFRLRERINAMGVKLADKIAQIKAELDEYFALPKSSLSYEILKSEGGQKHARDTILASTEIVKVASNGHIGKEEWYRSFRREQQ